MTASISDAVLKHVTDGSQAFGRDLWQSQACVVIVFRRPGCVLCRDEAQKVWQHKAEFDALGVNLVGLVHERVGDEIEQFHPAFWPGPLYIDEDKTFYKALGNGKLVKGSVFDLLNPMSKAWKNVRKAQRNVKDHNLKGDGLTMGGHFVVSKSGEVVFKHVEKTFGDHPPVSEVLEAAKQAASK